MGFADDRKKMLSLRYKYLIHWPDPPTRQFNPDLLRFSFILRGKLLPPHPQLPPRWRFRELEKSRARIGLMKY